MVLDTLGVSLLGNLLAIKGTVRAGKPTFTAGESIVRADQNF